ncbi:MAG: hypothetical protein JO041_16120 [Acidobacteria bacterium]|nr:hypothetical protein [Acidobacteriota bacterium]
MKKKKISPKVRRPLPRASDEMRQWAELLVSEVLLWANTAARPMFGMTALYRGRQIFAALPRTRALVSPDSIAFRLLRATEKETLRDPRLTFESPGAKWISFEFAGGQDIADALKWLRRAYRAAR